MKNKHLLILNSLDKITENHEESLVGGFSKSFSFQVRETSVGGPTDNCFGGNCTSGCGTNGNKGCNSVAGCGTILK